VELRHQKELSGSKIDEIKNRFLLGNQRVPHDFFLEGITQQLWSLRSSIRDYIKDNNDMIKQSSKKEPHQSIV